MSGRTVRTIRIFSLEVSPDLVLLNIRRLDFHDFLNVSSLQNSFTRAPNGGPKGPLPCDPLGSQGFPSYGGSGTPSHGIPWAPKGSLSHGSSPMGSLWDPFGLPRVPSHGVTPHPIPFRFGPVHPIVLLQNSVLGS